MDDLKLIPETLACPSVSSRLVLPFLRVPVHHGRIAFLAYNLQDSI